MRFRRSLGMRPALCSHNDKSCVSIASTKGGQFLSDRNRDFVWGKSQDEQRSFKASAVDDVVPQCVFAWRENAGRLMVGKQKPA